MTCDVVIVANYSNPELQRMTEECILSLRKAEHGIDFNVFVEVDDGMKPFNYNAMLCSGISKGSSEFIILANNDLTFMDNWFYYIYAAYTKGIAESFGCWSPLYHEKHFKVKQDYYLGYRISKEMTGWIIVTTRKVLERINFCSEENFRASFWYADTIYADLLQKHNIKHALIRNSKVTHLLGKTLKTKTKEEQKNLTLGQKQKYLTGIK